MHVSRLNAGGHTRDVYKRQVNLLTNVVAVLVSVATISGEIESHTIDAIVTKPIPRWQVIIGKWLGLSLIHI